MVVPKSHAYLPLPGPACPSPPPFFCLHSLSVLEIHAPTPRPLETPTTNLSNREMTQTPDRGGGTEAHTLVLLPAPRDAGTCREEERPQLPAHGLGETKNLFPSASPSPSWAGVRAARSTCWHRAHLQLGSPAAQLQTRSTRGCLGWGWVAAPRRQRAAVRRGEGAAGFGAGSRARPSAAGWRHPGARAGSRPWKRWERASVGVEGRSALEGGATTPRLRLSTHGPTREHRVGGGCP